MTVRQRSPLDAHPSSPPTAHHEHQMPSKLPFGGSFFVNSPKGSKCYGNIVSTGRTAGRGEEEEKKEEDSDGVCLFSVEAPESPYEYVVRKCDITPLT